MLAVIALRTMLYSMDAQGKSNVRVLLAYTLPVFGLACAALWAYLKLTGYYE